MKLIRPNLKNHCLLPIHLMTYAVLSLFLSLIFNFASAQMISTLAIANKEVLTTRTVHIDALIEALVFKEDKRKVAKLNIKDVLKSKLDSKVLKKQLDRLIIEKIVYAESQSLSQSHVTDKEIKEKQVKINLEVQKDKELKELWGFLTLTDAELKEVLKQKLTAYKFMEFKTRSSTIDPTDAEAFSYYQNNKSKFKEIPFSDLKESIKKEISKEQTEQRLSDWLEILKKKYEVSLITPV